MTTKLLKGALTRIAATAIAAVFFTPVASAATSSGDMDNPVTGETKTYDYKYVGSGTWTASDWQDANGAALAAAPGTDNSNLWGSMLVNCSNPISVAQLNGWELQLGVFGGANVTVGELGFWTGSDSCFAAVDNASSLTISATTGKNWNNTVKFYVANSGGITFTSAFAPANPNGTGNIHYYLKESGSVVYSSTLGGAVGHVIKQADVTLSGTSQVSSKTLVSFASTTKTFTADAAIKVYGTDGTTLATTVNLATVNTTGTTTLTTDNNAVGTCELVQTTTGIVLYWVDGDPAAIVPKTYTPSININFISSANYGLTTAADVGLSGYAVPGTSWNNFVVANNTTFNTVNAVDSTGTASEATGVSVTISGTRGAYSCSTLAAATNPLHGYIDENGENPAPTVTISGIPYSMYRVIVYHATDSANVPFGYDTINGTDYTYVDGALTEGATAWGASGGANSANAIAEGVNVLVTGEFIESSLTVVAHRAGGNSNARGCIAAIQIIDVTPAVGETDLEIPVSGDTTYTVDTARNLTGTVYLTGNGTLTLDGSAKISSAFVNVGPGVTLNVNADRLDAPTFTGSGTVVFDGVKPTAGKGWTDSSAWAGTVWVKNIPVNSKSAWTLADYGNAKSTLRFTDVNLYFASGTTAFPGTVDLDGTGMNVCDGYGGSITTIARLTGSGTLSTGGGSSDGNGLTINDASAFTGTITLTKFKVIIGTSTGTSASGVQQIDAGAVATVASGTTWTAPGGFVVNGTLNDNGTLTSSASAAVTGSGTVVFTGKLPSPTGDTWWKNANWTGTVQMKDVTLVGTSLAFNDYGNTGSVLELNGCSGWLTPAYTCTVPLKITGTLSLNDGYSNKGNAFKVGTLLGDGTISGSSKAPTMVFNVTTDWSGFTGKIALNNKCVVFGSTIPDTLAEGAIYIAEGAQVTVQNTANAAWWGVGGIKVDGELRAPNLGKFGGGTTITTTDNGVFTLVTNSTADDMNVDYARIQGTGTLRLEGSAYRCISTNNFPTAMTVDNRLTAGFLHRIPGLEITIGSLAGDGYLRSDWGGSAGDRDLRILQAKDTTWSGNFWASNPHRFRSLVVAPGATTSGTLTISATHVAAESTGLAVESGAAVNLTGTWVGDTTVSGTFGGTGTLTGNLTFSAGSTFKAFASDENGLSVYGSITYPASGTVTVDVSALGAPAAKVVLLTAASESDIDLTKFALADGTNRKYKLAKEGATLVVKRIKKVLVIVK